MVSIVFTDEDIRRTRLATGADMKLELALSLRLLRERMTDVRFQGWRTTLRSRWDPRSGLLFDLFDSTLVPEFLATLPDHRESAAATARAAADDEGHEYLTELAAVRPLSRFAHGIGARERQSLHQLGLLTAGYQSAAITPFWDQIESIVAAELKRRAGLLATSGALAVIAAAVPQSTHDGRILHVPTRCESMHRLDGRGLVLQPSVFQVRGTIVAGLGAGQQPVLAYPVAADHPALGSYEPTAVRSLVPLLGRTRAAALEAIATGGPLTTTELAEQLGISKPSASQHASVLNGAGLTSKERLGFAVVHTLTDLGAALLGGPATATGLGSAARLPERPRVAVDPILD